MYMYVIRYWSMQYVGKFLEFFENVKNFATRPSSIMMALMHTMRTPVHHWHQLQLPPRSSDLGPHLEGPPEAGASK